jgi:hypothetical protein
VSRFGNKESLDLYCNNQLLLHYRVTPGIEVDNFGRPVFYDNYFSKGVYAWSHHAIKKIKTSCHHGAAPFLYAKALTDVSDTPATSGVLTVLPKADINTNLDLESFSVEEGTDYLSFPGDVLRWSNFIPIDRIKTISHNPGDPLWQFKLAHLLIQYETVRFPTFSTILVSAIHSGVNIELYDGDILLKPGSDIIFRSCSFESMTKSSQDFIRAVPSIIQDDKDRQSLVSYFFSVDKIQKPDDLLKSLYVLNAANLNNFKPESLLDGYIDAHSHKAYGRATDDERLSAYEQLSELTFVKPSGNLEKLLSNL